MSFDIEPDAPIHGECAAEINRLEGRISFLEAACNQYEHQQRSRDTMISKLNDALLTVRDSFDYDPRDIAHKALVHQALLDLKEWSKTK